MEKKTWQTPKLVALVRDKPEEAVLSFCKGGSIGGPATQINLCNWMNYPPGGCVDLATCSAVGVS
jgi:hypothetical protein